MRTADFSQAPKQARGEALLIIESVIPTTTAAGHAPSSAHSVRSARSVARQASAARGYLWHKTFRRRGTRGVMVFFVQRPAAEEFRATLERASWSVRLLVAEPSGYSNGVWRAEGNVMAHIEHFTPTSVEEARGSTPPLVAGASPHRAGHPGGSATRGGGRARPVTAARAMFVGATKYRGPRALLTLSRTWYPMIARMQQLHGYVWHTVYWQPPFTLGTLAFFAERDDLLSFARLPAHRQLMQWITRDTKNGTGGYIRLHTAPDPPVDGSAVAEREAGTRVADHNTHLAVSDTTTDPDTSATTAATDSSTIGRIATENPS